MSLTSACCRHGLPILAMTGVLSTLASPALAQESSSSSSEAVAVGGGIDFASQYVFRGVRQNSTGLAVWPFVDLTARVLSGEGPVRRIDVSAGFWNSVHTGDTGSGGPIGKSWYEARFSGTLGFGFGGGVSVASTYTAYTSPNELFTTVKEISIELAVDDRGRLGAAAVRPYALVAFEIDAAPGVGQLDGGLKGGRYLELGAAPGYSRKRAALAFPVKVGLSLGDYYELAGEDNTFGFVSVGATASVPLGRGSRLGRWIVHGGVEIQALGETTKVFKGGDGSTVTASLGFGFRP